MLIDRETVMSGKAAQEPWKFYDLGHGYCAYDFFDQCPHRMAGALQLRQEILLNDAELAAVDDGVAANTLSMVGRTDLIEDYSLGPLSFASFRSSVLQRRVAAFSMPQNDAVVAQPAGR